MSDLGNKEIMAKNIRHYMGVFNVTQTEICNTLGIKMPTFSDWVNAKTYPRIDKIELMANYFGISKADLVEEHSSLTTRDNRDIEKKQKLASSINNPINNNIPPVIMAAIVQTVMMFHAI